VQPRFLPSPVIGQVDSPKVRPQVDNLPSTQPNQHTHCPKRKPLDPLVRALVRIPELLFSYSQIFHLLHNLIHCLLDSSQLRLDRLQLLLGLYGRPILRISADIDVQLDMPAGVLSYFYRLGVSVMTLGSVILSNLVWQGSRREKRGGVRRPESVFSKHTSKAVSARLVNAILFSPATSFGRPYSLPTASLICMMRCISFAFVLFRRSTCALMATTAELQH
jgi:hypothetical protein